MVSELPTIIIGSHTQGLTISVRGRQHPASSDYWDGNWLSTNIAVSIGQFRGSVDASLRAEDFETFHEQLQNVYQSLRGQADFQTMEGWLELHLVADKTGHIRLTGELLDQPGIGNRLSFSLDLDQTFLPATLSALSRIISTFPVIGKP